MKPSRRHILTFSILTMIGCAIAYIVVVFAHKNSVIVEMANENLTVDGKLITKLIVNPKDGLPDFPASTYYNFTITPLKTEIQEYAADSDNSLQIRVPDSYIYAVWKPLLLTAQECRFKSITIGCTRNWSVIQLFDNPILSDEITLSNRSYDTISARAIIFITPDSIILKRSNLGIYFSSPPNPMMRDSGFFQQDSIIDAIFLKREIAERLFVMKSKYSEHELMNLIGKISDSTEASGRIDLQIRPATSCIQIVNFLRDFNRIIEANHETKNSNNYIDNTMKFSI